MPTINGIMIFSHIIPVVLGFFGVLTLINGIMDDKQDTTIIGTALILIGVAIPFLILPFLIS